MTTEDVAQVDPVVRVLDFVQCVRQNAFSKRPGVAVRTDGHVLFGYAVCACLGRSSEERTFTLEEQLADYRTLLIMCAKAEGFVTEKSPPKALARNQGVIYTITKVFRANTVQSIAANVAAALQSDPVERLKLLSDNLAHLGEETMISNQEINAVIERLDDLVRFVQESRLDDRLKDALLRTLGLLRMEMTRVNIVGSDLVVDELDRLLGQSVRAAITPTTGPQHQDGVEVFRRSVDIAETVGRLVDVGQKVYPVLERGAELLRQLPF
ncbi:hypothetical protein [Deinococcus sp. NW-56]|uniref:hypothetical protein n=1 Tax=Deinococcus sp. NW-56 TaxID=2080419 RepID=UPI000CF3678B|nr:hypothetical protein [Deinococcus sp. NW-56]